MAAAYRFFKVEDDHVVGVSEIIHCDNDKDAIRHAKQLANGHDIEVWDESRCVIRVEGSKAKTK